MASFNKAKKEKKSWVINTKKYSYAWWAFPLIPIVEAVDYIENKIEDRRTWSDEKAKKVLDKILPKVLEYLEEEDAFYYCMCWTEWELVDNAPLVHRKWVKKFRYDLHQFVLKGYENKDYDKTLIREYDETWIKFTEK